MSTQAAKTEATKEPVTEDGLPAPVPAKAPPDGRLSDEDLAAELEALEKAEEEKAPAAEKKPEAKADEKKDPKDPPPAEKKEGEIEVKLDDKASKSIEATNRYRAQVERQLQQREESVAKREADLAPRLARLEAYEKAAAQRDPEALAQAMGFSPDEYEAAAQVLYRMSKSASPADRAAAQQLVRSRQASGEVAELRKTVEELTKSIQQRDQQAQQQAFVQQYAAQLTGAVVATEQPLVANALKNAPREAQQELLQLAARMEQANRGMTPEPAEVLKQYEQRLRQQAKALGFDPTQIGKQDTTTTPTPENNGQKKTTAGLTQDLGPQTRSRTAPKSRDEAFDETTREIEEMERKNRRA